MIIKRFWRCCRYNNILLQQRQDLNESAGGYQYDIYECKSVVEEIEDYHSTFSRNVWK